MTTGRADDTARPAPRRRAASTGVLADRMAAALVHHEPGWRLPRLTALARRYSVSAAEVDAAIDELAARHLVRRLPDGQVYRASPAEYWVPLEGMAGLSSFVDPMGGVLACKSRTGSVRRAPEDVSRSLGLAPGERVLVVRALWTVGGEPAALSASYLPEEQGTILVPFPPSAPLVDGTAPADAWNGGPADPGIGEFAAFPAGDPLVPGPGEPAEAETLLFPWRPPAEGPPARPRALQVEMGLPPPSAARTLRLAAGEPAASITVSFADPAGSPVALTTALLRLEMFRIVVAAPAATGETDHLATAWTHGAAGWES